MRITVGAGKTSYDGWISTQESELNLLNRADMEGIAFACMGKLL